MAKTFVSLFGGVGGFDLALIRNGWECVGYYEWDKRCVSQYNKQFNTNYKPTDITQLRTEDVPEHYLLVGGFPCQAFSLAGKRRGFEDTRGTLFFEISRIAQAKRPKIMLLENVKGLLNHQKGQTFRVILQTLDELGYNVQHMVLNSKFFGVPQNRERVFFVCSLRGEPRPEILPFFGATGENPIMYQTEDSKPEIGQANRKYVASGGATPLATTWKPIIQVNNPVHSNDRVYLSEGDIPSLNTAQGGLRQPKILQHLGDAAGNTVAYNINEIAGTLKQPSGNQQNYIIQSHSPRSGDPNKGGTGPLRSSEFSFTLDSSPHNVIVRAVLTPDRLEKRQNGRRFKDPGEESFTLTNQDVHGNAVDSGNSVKIRRLTPLEYERLQGFPDGWTAGQSDTQRYKQLGNAVTVNVIDAILKSWSRAQHK